MQQQTLKRMHNLLAAASALTAQTGCSMPHAIAMDIKLPVKQNDDCSMAHAIAMHPQYRSRGKGRGETPKARKGKHMDQVRAARAAHNKNKRSK